MKKHLLIAPALTCAFFGFGCSKSMPESTSPALTTPTPAPTAQVEVPKTTTTTNQENKPAQAPTPTPTTQTAPKPSVKPKTTTTTKPSPAYQVVTITSSGFSPQIIAIFEGDGVTWVNKDTVSHTSRSEVGLLWESGAIAPGAKYSHVFPAAGTYPYTDGNTGKKGTVVVTQRPK